MTITYTEFDTTPAGLVAALRTNILANPHWSDQGVVAVSTTSTGSAVSNGTSVTLTSVAGFNVGSIITVQPGGVNEQFRTITAISGTTVTISGQWGVTYGTGTTFRAQGTVLRSTSDRGANLIVDLQGGQWDAASANYLGIAAYRQYTGTAPGGQTDTVRHYQYWKAGSGTLTMPLHVTLSVGKNHLFFSIEGPRPTEPSPQSTTYGSLKTYWSISDIIPYHASDTVPAAVVSACSAYTPQVSSNAHIAPISRDSTNTYSWSNGRLASLDWPTAATSDVVTMPRECTIDGNTYLFPYVVFSEQEGIRGRLSSFFYCGTNTPTPQLDMPEPVGSKVTYDGIVYKLLAVTKGDGTYSMWGPFGSSSNTTTILRSVIVAVPFADAV